MSVQSHMDMMSQFQLDGGMFEPGFYIGSDGDDGEHLRDTTGWPYSIYRRAAHVGGTDACLCIGIQSLGDADRLCEMLNQIAGVSGRSLEHRR